MRPGGATFVLIHSPIVGPATWRPVAAELEAMGLAAAVPVLTGAKEWTGPIEAASRETESHAADAPLVMCAHSAAGLLLAPLVERWQTRLRGAIWVDASLPGPRSMLADRSPDQAAAIRESAVAGMVPAWGGSWSDHLWASLIPDVALRDGFRAELQPTPLSLYEAEVPLAPEPDPARCAYLRFSPFYRVQQEQAASLGWATATIPGQHLHMLAEPGAVAASLVELAAGFPA